MREKHLPVCNGSGNVESIIILHITWEITYERIYGDSNLQEMFKNDDYFCTIVWRGMRKICAYCFMEYNGNRIKIVFKKQK